MRMFVSIEISSEEILDRNRGCALLFDLCNIINMLGNRSLACKIQTLLNIKAQRLPALGLKRNQDTRLGYTLRAPEGVV